MQPTTMTPDQGADAPPDHTQLPDQDGNHKHNFQEPPQSDMLTQSMRPRLDERHPDGQYCIGQDSGIYFRHTKPPLDGCKAPDWFYVSNVPPMLNGQFRRSYVLWQESVRPFLVIEYASGDGSEERDNTPLRGKFWVYEQAIAAPYYAIFEFEKGMLELFKLNGGCYHSMAPNAAGRLPIEALAVELGVWQGAYQGMTGPWLRVWDATTGLLLPTDSERAEAEQKRAEAEQKRAETSESLLDEARDRLEEETERAENERKLKDKLAERLRALGIDPDAP
jgi:Uma2 family endonuclease